MRLVRECQEQGNQRTSPNTFRARTKVTSTSFFRMGESAMHTSGSFLKSLALQLAVGHESVRDSLVTLYQDGVHLGTAEARMVLQKAFVATIF